jgi:tight adherence protein C
VTSRWRRIRRPWLRIPPLALAALVLAPGALAANVRIAGVDVGGYPDVRVTAVTPAGSAQPQLRENGVPVTGLTAVDLGRSKDVVLIVDCSQSMRGRALADAVAGARAFVAAKQPGDRIEVVALGHRPIAITSFSSDGADADAALSSIAADPVSGTALWDSVTLAAHRLARDPEPGRVILVLTDGRDVSSKASFADAVAAADRARASVYPIGILGADFTPAPLEALAQRTGGAYHQARSTSQLAAIYGFIGRVLSHSWVLRYPTSARPGDDLQLTAVVPGVGSATQSVRLTGVGGTAETSPGVLPASTWTAAWMPFAIAGAVGLLFLLAAAFWFSSRKGTWVKDRLEPHLGVTRRTVRVRHKRGRREVLQRLFAATERVLANVKQFRTLQSESSHSRGEGMLFAFLIGIGFLGFAGYLVAEAASATGRQRQLSLERAARYGRVRTTRTRAAERVPFRDRVLGPAVNRLAAMTLRLSPKATVDSIASRLLAAGLAPRFSATQFLAVKSGLALGGSMVALLFGLSTSPVTAFLLVPMAGVFGFLLPDSVLTMRVRSRRELIRAQLPDVLDLLAVSVEAGLGFDGALAKLTENMEGPLVSEFALTLGEIRIGESRQEALRKLAERANVPELSAFVRSVIQADQLGISLGRILRVQAADSRLRRQAAAEEKAMKAPIKMLFPTVLFIFPAMFVVILGPAAMNLAHLLK